jgi:putative hemolysin
METAFVSSRKIRLQAWAEGGDKKCWKVLKAMEDSSRFTGSLKIGIIFLSILAGAVAGLYLLPYLGFRLASLPLWGVYGADLILIAGLTAVSILFCDILPKQIARTAPERITIAFLPFLRGLTGFCSPLLILYKGFSKFSERMLKIPPDPGDGMTEDELRITLTESEKSGILESQERTMIEGVFYLGQRPVGTFMTHRSEVLWLDLNETPEVIRAAAVDRKDQRFFPVADGNLDEVVGVVSAQDILIASLETPEMELKSILKPPFFVPETLPALKTFEAFKKGDADFLLVMDEYGGFAGILSLNTLIVEIVGQISPPTGHEDKIIKQDDGAYLIDGGINIDEAAKTLGIESLPQERQTYHTLAGFILSLTGEIPRTGAQVEYWGYRFQVVSMDGNRIGKVLIRPLEFG